VGPAKERRGAAFLGWAADGELSMRLVAPWLFLPAVAVARTSNKAARLLGGDRLVVMVSDTGEIVASNGLEIEATYKDGRLSFHIGASSRTIRYEIGR